MNKVKLSVVIPFYNEKDNLDSLHRELVDVLRNLKFISEIIYVDDGSSDGSSEIIKKINWTTHITKHIRTHLIELRGNFGQTAAMMAGINQATGEFISFLDADLQNDPRDLPMLLSYIRNGYDAVFGWRRKRQDGIWRNFPSIVANSFIRILFKVPLHDVGCSLKIYRANILKGINFYGETHRVMSVITYWQGARIMEVPVHHRPRISGLSKYGYSRVVKLLIDLVNIKFFTSYGTKPGYVFGTIGIISNLIGLGLLIIVAYHKLFQGVYVHRDPLFLIAIFLVLVGIQFILMGVLAELQMRTYYESQNKRIYLIKKVYTFHGK